MNPEMKHVISAKKPTDSDLIHEQTPMPDYPLLLEEIAKRLSQQDASFSFGYIRIPDNELIGMATYTFRLTGESKLSRAFVEIASGSAAYYQDLQHEAEIAELGYNERSLRMRVMRELVEVGIQRCLERPDEDAVAIFQKETEKLRDQSYSRANEINRLHETTWGENM